MCGEAAIQTKTKRETDVCFEALLECVEKVLVVMFRVADFQTGSLHVETWDFSQWAMTQTGLVAR